MENRNANLGQLFPAASDRSSGRQPAPLPSPDNPIVVQRLSTKARMVLALQLRGLSKSEIAVRLRMKETAVHYIMHTKRYIDARAVLLDYLDQEFIAMKPAAFNALRRGLASSDENVALQASEQWMRTSGFMQHRKGERTQGVTAEDVVRQLLGVTVRVNVDDARAKPASNASLLSVRGTTEPPKVSVNSP